MALIKTEQLYWQEVEQIIGCAFRVSNNLGSGFLEKVYENALCVEFKLNGIPFLQQPRYDVLYKGVNVGTYIPDLVAFSKIIIDTKTIESITNVEEAQILNYMRISGLRVGLIINFSHTHVEWKKLVL